MVGCRITRDRALCEVEGAFSAVDPSTEAREIGGVALDGHPVERQVALAVSDAPVAAGDGEAAYGRGRARLVIEDLVVKRTCGPGSSRSEAQGDPDAEARAWAAKLAQL